MSRSTADSFHALPAAASRHISRAEIDAAIREGHRLRAEAIGAWLGQIKSGVHGVVIRVVAVLRRRRMIG